MKLDEPMRRMDELLSHVWMVRAFLKHSDEAQEDDELASVHRDLYDFMLALGPAIAAGDTVEYFRMAARKLSRFRRAVETFRRIQPQISEHTNFRMAVRSLSLAFEEVVRLMDSVDLATPSWVAKGVKEL